VKRDPQSGKRVAHPGQRHKTLTNGERMQLSCCEKDEEVGDGALTKASCIVRLSIAKLRRWSELKRGVRPQRARIDPSLQQSISPDTRGMKLMDTRSKSTSLAQKGIARGAEGKSFQHGTRVKKTSEKIIGKRRLVCSGEDQGKPGVPERTVEAARGN